MITALPLLLLLLAPAGSLVAPPAPAPRLELSPEVRGFLDRQHAAVAALDLALPWHFAVDLPPSVLGGPTLADPTQDPSVQALFGLQYAAALLFSLGNITADGQASDNAIPGLIRNRDWRGVTSVFAPSPEPGTQSER